MRPSGGFREPGTILDRLWRSRGGRRQARKLFLVAAAILAALIPVTLFAGLWVKNEFGRGRHDIESFLATRSENLVRSVDASVGEQVSAMLALSTLPSLDDGPNETFATIAQRLAAIMPDWAGLGLLDPADGRMLVGTAPGLADGLDRAALKEAGDTKRPVFRTIQTPGHPPGDLMIFVPVVRNESVKAVLLVELGLESIQRIVADPSENRDVLRVLLDGSGRIVARSRRAEDFVGRDGGELAREAATGAAGGERGIVAGTSLEGEGVTAAFARSRLTGWTAVTAIDRRTIDRLSSRSVWATVAAGVLSLILAAVLTVFVIHTVMERRISDERLAASQALGELDARLLATTQEALGEQRKSASEREILLREIYHRVKNNLQIVQSLLRLGSRDLHPDQREPFENAVRRIGAMARVHTLLYNSPDLASIDFRDYLEELLRDLSEGFGAEERSIESVLDAHSMRVPLDTAVPLAFIAVEILTNSYRHAFPSGRPGTITIEARRDGGTGVLRIADDGIGFAGDGAARRLGLTMVSKLVQQIGGSINGPAPGSSQFEIVFPLDEAAVAGAPLAPA